MNGFTWRLRFDSTVARWPGNAVLMLCLCSLPPKVGQIDCEFKVIFKELGVACSATTSDDGAHKSFGWSKGRCMTADILKLKEFTFGVVINVYAVYNKNGDDVTDSYIEQSISSLSIAESSNVTKSLRSLTVRLDSLTVAMDTMQKQMVIMQTRLDEEEKENSNDVKQQIDDIKSTVQQLVRGSHIVQMNTEVTEEALFRKWVVNTLNYPEYYELFVENGVETINVAKLLTKSELRMIGINKIGHQLKIMQSIEALKQKQDNLVASTYQQAKEGGTVMI